jgi:nucleoside triphosphatase
MTKQKRYPEPTVGGLILNDKKQIFLAKSHKWKNRWTVPGGHIELGEKVEEALKREIEEETGLEIEPVRFLLLQEAIYSEEFYKPKHFIFLDYLCEAKTTDVKVDKDEMQDFVWIEPRKALEMNIDSFTKRALKKYLEIRG